MFVNDGSEWSRVAAVYRWQMPLERPALAQAVVLAAPRRSDRVLDLGTGTGGMLEELARAAEPPEAVVGVDRSRAMLAHVGKLPNGWKLACADARSLPLDTCSFDLITAAYLLHVASARDRAAILHEASRVLARRGRLVVVTPAEPFSLLGRILYAPLGCVGCRSGGLLAGFCPLDPRRDLESAGFRVRAVRYVDRGYRSWCVLAESSPPHPRKPRV
jgi:ubiquinone/menaquinone biosynthesis C-methylase UbiE